MGYISTEAARIIREPEKRRCRRCNELRALSNYRLKKEAVHADGWRRKAQRVLICKFCEADEAREYARKKRGQKICEHCGSLYREKRNP